MMSSRATCPALPGVDEESINGVTGGGENGERDPETPLGDTCHGNVPTIKRAGALQRDEPTGNGAIQRLSEALEWIKP
jgi:hypothetical protein